jgi:hypothetical protein
MIDSKITMLPNAPGNILLEPFAADVYFIVDNARQSLDHEPRLHQG